MKGTNNGALRLINNAFIIANIQNILDDSVPTNVSNISGKIAMNATVRVRLLIGI